MLGQRFSKQWQELAATLPALNAGISGAWHHPLIIAVSGGPDSLALLHLICQNDLHPKKNITVCTLDHQLRPESGAEAAFVQKMAQQWGVGFIAGKRDVPAFASQQKLSIEEAARKARYQFLAETAQNIGAKFILVGHHADDQAETVLMHLLRGSSLRGLQGMLPASPLPWAPSLTLLRPLLPFTRVEIEAYCLSNQLQPKQDASNKDVTYFRNRVRHELMPALTTYNPNIKERLTTLATTVQADEAYLAAECRQSLKNLIATQGKGWLSLDIYGWRQLPTAMQRRTLRQAIILLNPAIQDIGFATIEQACQVALRGNVRSESLLPGKIRLRVGYEQIEMSLVSVKMPAISAPQMSTCEPLELSLPGKVNLNDGWVIETVKNADLNDSLKSSNRWSVKISIPTAEKLFIRCRLPGEKFQPLGMGGQAASLKKVMINRKMPAALRSHWPLAATSKHLVWLPGHHIDERVKIKNQQNETVWWLSCRHEV